MKQQTEKAEQLEIKTPFWWLIYALNYLCTWFVVRVVFDIWNRADDVFQMWLTDYSTGVTDNVFYSWIGSERAFDWTVLQILPIARESSPIKTIYEDNCFTDFDSIFCFNTTTAVIFYRV